MAERDRVEDFDVWSFLAASRRRRSEPPLQEGSGVLRGARAALHSSDLALFENLSRVSSPTLDRILPRLTRAADYSLLWIGVAAVMTVAGGPRGRQAARCGVASIALASPVVNLPAKLATRRQRPPPDLVPLARRARRMPTSGSFPSGHAASAAAFATGVGLQAPRLAVPVGLLAMAVAYSRVYTGVHYPGDVAGGAALGIGAALVIARIRSRALLGAGRPETTK